MIIATPLTMEILEEIHKDIPDDDGIFGSGYTLFNMFDNPDSLVWKVWRKAQKELSKANRTINQQENCP